MTFQIGSYTFQPECEPQEMEITSERDLEWYEYPLTQKPDIEDWVSVSAIITIRGILKDTASKTAQQQEKELLELQIPASDGTQGWMTLVADTYDEAGRLGDKVKIKSMRFHHRLVFIEYTIVLWVGSGG